MGKEGFTEDQLTEIQLMIDDAVAKAVSGAHPKLKVKEDPDFNTDGKIQILDTVVLTPTKGWAEYAARLGHAGHKFGEEYKVQGHQATTQVRKGLATFVRVDKVWVKPEQRGRVIGKA